MSDLSSVIFKPGELYAYQEQLFQALGSKELLTRLVYPARLSFIVDREIRTLHGKYTLRNLQQASHHYKTSLQEAGKTAQWVKVLAMHAWRPDPTVGRKNGPPNSLRGTDEQEN